mgnify:FL=1
MPISPEGRVTRPAPTPQIELFHPQTTPKPWGNEVLIAQGPGYTGKILHRLSGPQYHRAGLQFHTRKTETFHLYSGLAWVYFIKGGEVYKILLKPGMSVHVPAGAIHSVATQGISVMFEAAEYAPDSETINVEADYNVADAIEVPPERL